MGLRVAAADDNQVLVNAARRGKRDGLLFPGLTQTLAEVDAAALAEAGDGFAGPGVEAIKVVHYAGQDALVVTRVPVGAVGPVGDTAAGLR